MISEEEIRRVATLAHLELNDEEMQKFSRELSDILDFFDALQEVDTDGVEPTAQVTGLKNVTREDHVDKCGYSDELLKASPHKVKDHQIEVNEVL